MGYYIDLQNISIDDFKKILKSADMIPSWMVLKEDIEKNLDKIKKHNVHNLDELSKALKSKKRVEEFSTLSGLTDNYLAVLRRMINGYRPKPSKIEDFLNVPKNVVAKLDAIGLKNTKQLYGEILTPEKRNELSSKTGISKKEIIRLTKLTDLSRIRWVGHTFAYVLLESGYDTAQKVANSNYKNLYETVKKLNKEKEIYKGNIGEHDMKLCTEAAKVLDFEIEY